jgi:hypothetical protein
MALGLIPGSSWPKRLPDEADLSVNGFLSFPKVRPEGSLAPPVGGAAGWGLGASSLM